jgi:hypothetical protein
MNNWALLVSHCPWRPAAERQREAELRQRQQAAAAQPQEQRQDNEGLVTAMNRAMTGMRQYQYQLYRNPEVGCSARSPRLVIGIHRPSPAVDWPSWVIGQAG